MQVTMQNSMRVSQNYATKNYKKTEAKNSLASTIESVGTRIQGMPSSYAQAVIGAKKVSFGDSDNLPVPVTPTPLEKKVGAVIPLMSKNDIVLVGPNLKKAQEALKNSIDQISGVISKIYTVEDSSISSSFVLKQNEKSMLEIMNLNEQPITLLSHGKTYPVKKGDSSYLLEEDKIKLDGHFYNFKEDFDATTDTYKSLGINVFDFTSKDKNSVTKLNTKHLDQLFYEANPEKAPKKLTFADVGGQDAAIKELKKSIVYPLKYPSAYKNNILNHGIVLTGGPGTGKTLLAQALANETDAYFMQLNGLEMESKWVGASEENWRNLFQAAKDNQPSIIFIDEFDAVARKREGSDTSRFDDKVVNQLLTLMSDLEKSKDEVYVIVATNRLNLLDDAILRSGRFGKHIAVNNPDLSGCKKILGIHSEGKPVSDGFDSEEFAQELFANKVNGADIAKIVNDANANAFERLGIYEKMENDAFEDSDIENLRIEPEDFYKALDDFKEQSKLSGGEKPKNPIGFQPPSEPKQQSQAVA